MGHERTDRSTRRTDVPCQCTLARPDEPAQVLSGPFNLHVCDRISFVEIKKPWLGKARACAGFSGRGSWCARHRTGPDGGCRGLQGWSIFSNTRLSPIGRMSGERRGDGRPATFRRAHAQGKIMSNWLVAVLFGLSIAIGIGGSTAAAADDLQPAATVYTLSSGRIGALVALVAGLIGTALGGLVVARSRRTG